MPSYKPVNAVLRSFDVLAAVNKLRGRASVGELHRETTLDKATIVRMLETLIHAGYVVRDEDRAIYEVTGKTLLLCAGYDRHRAMARIVGPIMSDFRNQIGWPSDVAIFDRDAMLVVETSRQTGPMLVNRHPGYRAPILATSLGLAYLAFIDPLEREQVLAREAEDPAAWNDIARDPNAADRLFAGIRERGYATMHEEYSRIEYARQISTVGVPILHDGTAVAAMNVLFLKNAVPIAQAVETLTPTLLSCAEKISKDMAGSWHVA